MAAEAPTAEPSPANTTPAQTADAFKAIKKNAFKAIRKKMTRAQVQALVGKPGSVTGSGLYIEVYPLADKSSVLLGWTGPTRNATLVYVKHRGTAGDTELLQP